MGGNAAGEEIDAGLSWEVIREPDGTVSKQRKAFRPFWRNEGWHSAPARPEYYYYPGDTVMMSVVSDAPRKLRLEIVLLARAVDTVPTSNTAINLSKPVHRGSHPADDINTASSDASPTSSTTRSRFSLAQLRNLDPISTFTTTFEASKFGPTASQAFKRVNAIDQTANENKPAQASRTRVENANWLQVDLITPAGKVPFTQDLFTDMRCPDASAFTISPVDEKGGEKITINAAAISSAPAD
jgi:hypothetical protein